MFFAGVLEHWLWGANYGAIIMGCIGFGNIIILLQKCNLPVGHYSSLFKSTHNAVNFDIYKLFNQEGVELVFDDMFSDIRLILIFRYSTNKGVAL